MALKIEEILDDGTTKVIQPYVELGADIGDVFIGELAKDIKEEGPDLSDATAEKYELMLKHANKLKDTNLAAIPTQLDALNKDARDKFPTLAAGLEEVLDKTDKEKIANADTAIVLYKGGKNDDLDINLPTKVRKHVYAVQATLDKWKTITINLQSLANAAARVLGNDNKLVKAIKTVACCIAKLFVAAKKFFTLANRVDNMMQSPVKVQMLEDRNTGLEAENEALRAENAALKTQLTQAAIQAPTAATGVAPPPMPTTGGKAPPPPPPMPSGGPRFFKKSATPPMGQPGGTTADFEAIADGNAKLKTPTPAGNAQDALNAAIRSFGEGKSLKKASERELAPKKESKMSPAEAMAKAMNDAMAKRREAIAGKEIKR